MTPDVLLTHVKAHFAPLLWHDGGNTGKGCGPWQPQVEYAAQDVVIVTAGYLISLETHTSGDDPPAYEDGERWKRHIPSHVILLRKALGTFQDRSGVTRSIDFGDTNIIPVPDNFLMALSASDAKGRYHEVNVIEGNLVVSEKASSVKPYRVTYFLNLRDWPMIEDLPPEILGYVSNYLVALFELKNTQRARRVALASGQSGDQFPSDEELKSRLTALEEAMEDTLGIIPGISVVY